MMEVAAVIVTAWLVDADVLLFFREHRGLRAVRETLPLTCVRNCTYNRKVSIPCWSCSDMSTYQESRDMLCHVRHVKMDGDTTW